MPCRSTRSRAIASMRSRGSSRKMFFRARSCIVVNEELIVIAGYDERHPRHAGKHRRKPRLHREARTEQPELLKATGEGCVARRLDDTESRESESGR